MKNIRNGRAFPSDTDLNEEGQFQGGLTKREYFAACALTGYIASHSGDNVQLPSNATTAKHCVEYADALLAELSTNKESGE